SSLSRTGLPFPINPTSAGRTEGRQSEGCCPRPDLHRHCARFKWAASALGYVGKLGGALPVAAACPHNRQWHRIRFALASMALAQGKNGGKDRKNGPEKTPTEE